MDDYSEGHLGYILASRVDTTQLEESACPVKLWQDYAKNIEETNPRISAFILGVIDKIPIDKAVLAEKKVSLEHNLLCITKLSYENISYKEECNTYGYYIFTDVSNEYWIGYVPSCVADGFSLSLYIMVANNMAETIESQVKDFQYLTPLGRFNTYWHYFIIMDNCDENCDNIENAIRELYDKFVKIQEEQIKKNNI